MRSRTILLFCLTILSLFIQKESFSQAYSKGDLTVGFGAGVPLSLGFSFNNPIVYGIVDYGITERVSLGAFGAYSKNKGASSTDFTNTHTIYGINALYHFDLGFEKLDLHAGASLANHSATTSNAANTYSNNVSSIIFGGVFGMDLLVTEKLKLFMNYGYGTSSGILGFGYIF